MIPKKTRFFFTLLVCIFSALAVFANDFPPTYPFGLHLEQDEFLLLQNGDSLMDYMEISPIPRRIPVSPLTESLKKRFPIDVYGDIIMLRKRTDDLDNESFLLNGLNRFLSFSDQKGIEYTSDNHGLITLINDSYSLNDRMKKCDDQELTSLPRDLTVYAYQKDYYFSGNKFRYDITSVDEGVRIRANNLNDMRVKGIFKAIDKNKMDMEFYILTDSEYVCVYGIALVEDIQNPVEAFGISVDIPSAMSKRMRAIMEWFLDTP